jgi:prepilin-type N-terminal cleavage/methylation domain-containing protein
MKLNKKGITLIELVIAVGLLSMVMAMGYSFYLMGVKGFLRESTSVDNQFQVRHASYTIGRQIRRADTVTIDIGKLKLTYPDGSSLVYQLQGDAIMGGSYKLVEGINSFEVSKHGDTILLTIRSKDNSDDKAYEITSEITIRK